MAIWTASLGLECWPNRQNFHKSEWYEICSAFSIMVTSELKASYLGGDPFPHIVIDHFLDDNLARTIESEIDGFTSWSGEKRFYGSMKKRHCGDISKLPPNARDLIHTLNGPSFLRFLEGTTGIDHLIPDPYLEGGGFHSIGAGGFLKIHADFNWHSKLQLHRRLRKVCITPAAARVDE